MPNIRNLIVTGAVHVAGRLNKLGRRHQCYICKKRFHRFLPWRGGKVRVPPIITELEVVGSDPINFACPYCGANDRERHLFMYFDRLKLWDHFINANVLHFAPEKHLAEKIESLRPKEYVQADIQPPNKQVRKIDVTSIDFPDKYFGLIICNHVLEHVSEDERAIKELWRVQKDGGSAILQTPYSPLLAKSFEDPSINTDQLRFKCYGGETHVRIYGRDFFDRLNKTGFTLQAKTHSDCFPPKMTAYFGVNPKEDLVLVRKARLSSY